MLGDLEKSIKFVAAIFPDAKAYQLFPSLGALWGIRIESFFHFDRAGINKGLNGTISQLSFILHIKFDMLKNKISVVDFGVQSGLFVSSKPKAFKKIRIWEFASYAAISQDGKRV